MKINEKQYTLRRFKDIAGLGFVYLDDQANEINGRKTVFGDPFQSKVVREIEERELRGHIVPNWRRAYGEFVGKIFQGKNNLSAKRKLLKISQGEFRWENVKNGKIHSTTPRMFHNWATKENISILKNEI